MSTDNTLARRSATILPAPRAEDTRWRSHPVAANAVRLFAVSVPLVCSVAGGVMASRLLPRPHGVAATVVWWLGIMLLSTVVLVVVDRGARRALPLATLLKLSMAFPDQAPSRFRVAARAGTTRSLEDKLRQAEATGFMDGTTEAAQRILMLVGALGAHDRRTRGHSERVRAFNDLIAEEMRLPQHDRDRLRWAALLHDIGKLHVSTSILNKPKKPNEREWTILRGHPERGARIAAPLAEWLGPWAPTIVQHHERWDGAGYPHGLSGEDICLGARIVAVADAYEVMTAPRPYSRPVGASAARQELAKCAGTQFDPDVVRAFLNISIGRLRKVIGPLSWLAQLPIIGATPKLEAALGQAGRQVASVAATATGTGVMAAAMMPAAAQHHAHHAHHHHHHGVVGAHHQAHHAAATTTDAAGTGGPVGSVTTTRQGDGTSGAASQPGSPVEGSGTTTTGSAQTGGPQEPAQAPSSAPAPSSTDSPSAAPAPTDSATPPPPSTGGGNPAPSPSPSASASNDPQPGHGSDTGHGH